MSNFQSDTVHDIFERFARVAVFLEQAIRDEGGELGNEEFKKKLEKIDGEIRSILCKTKVIIYSRNERIRSRVPRSVMSIELRSVEKTSEKRIRDYIVLRDTKGLLKVTQDEVDELIKKL